VAETRVAELTRLLQAKVNDINLFVKDGIKVDGEKVEVKGEDKGKVQKLLAEANELKDYINAAKFGHDNGNYLAEMEGSKAVEVNAENATIRDALQGKSLGEAFVRSEMFGEFAKSGQLTMRQPYSLETYDLSRKNQFKDVYGAMNPHDISLGIGTRPQFDATVPRGQRTARVRDLFPVATTANNLIDFFRVMGFLENAGKGAAATVPDYTGGTFGMKPKSNLNFQPAQAPVRTIAHWEAAHRNVIQDVPQLQATINNELLYGLALVEDEQILRGDGLGENLLGVLNTPGIQVYAAGANELKADSLRKAQTLSVIANFPSTGYVLHPNDWEDIELDKGTTNDHYRIVTSIAIGAEQRVWRLPVVETPAMEEQTFLSGAFGTGAQLYDRQQANVRVAEQHADFFVHNAVVILVEERLALAVKRPEAFVKGTFYEA
jgi:HK97 family phage major capsid protein